MVSLFPTQQGTHTFTQIQIDGHKNCHDCGKPVPEHAYWQTNARCFQCFLRQPEFVKLHNVEAAITHNRIAVPDPGNTRKRSQWEVKIERRVGGKDKQVAVRQRGKLLEQARRRASKRLTRLYPAMYSLLLAEEREKFGMEMIANRTKNYLADAVSTYVPPETYDPDAATGSP